MYRAIQSALKALANDPRHYQIACLLTFVVIGSTVLDFGIQPTVAFSTVAAALLSQALCSRLVGLSRLDLRSPLISSLSLCLLLRTNSITLAVGAAVLAIVSKFAIRYRGKHIFNPTNIAIVVVTLAFDGAWVSPGQWGSAAWSGLLLVCLGGLVLNRSRRSDIALAVLGFYALMHFGRAAWLGDPFSIPFRQMQSGATLIFAFFMISDPKTTPDTRLGRILFAALVVAFAGGVQFALYKPNGLLYGLAALAVFVPLIDRLLPGDRFEWKPTVAHAAAKPKGTNHESNVYVGTGAGALSHGLR